MTVVHLWDTDNAWLIIKAKTGVRYSNQTNGHACSHPGVEGFLVPLARAGQLSEELGNCFEGSWNEDVTAERADQIDALIANALEYFALSVDRTPREFVDASHEAWVHVIATPLPGANGLDRLETEHGNMPLEAILTWLNSD